MFNGRIINLSSIGKRPTNEELEALNRISKPGNGYELTVGETGVVEWQEYDDLDGTSKVTVRFEPQNRRLSIRCHADVSVTVNKWQKC